MKLVGVVLVASAIACGNKGSEPAKAAATMPTPAEAAPAPSESMTAAADTAPIAEAAPETTPGPTGPSASTVAGCAGTAMTAKSKPKHPEAAEALTVKADGQSIVATHVIGHACCLKGDVTTDADGASVVIHEKLTGKPCKCRCGSTIETRLPVHPGTYDVRVVVEEPGDTARDAGTQQVTVP